MRCWTVRRISEGPGGPLARRAAEGSARPKVVRPAAKRLAVVCLMDRHEMSQRRACHLIGADRSMFRYCGRRPEDAALRERMRELAGNRRRFGYRRLHLLLRQEGLVVNRKRTQRIYREEGLSVKRRRGLKKGRHCCAIGRSDNGDGTRAPILVEAVPNARWSVDFVHGQLAAGRRLRILNVITDLTKECLAAVVDRSISGRRVARELSGLIATRGSPGMIVRDHGTEFTSHAMLEWTQKTGVPWHFIAPGKTDAERDLRSV